MSQETNNEIDLLLRRMAGRDHGNARNVGASGRDLHLDVDELSSYAQNALPAAARARYTEHLAECATCRRLVTELSLSLGAAAAPVATAHEPSGWKKFLAGLFSPLVLRYAVPALGVIVVMVVGVVVLRQQRQHSFVAQLQDNKTAVPAAAPSSETAASEGFTNNKQPQEFDKIESNNAKPGESRRKTEGTAGDASGAASADAPVPAVKDGSSVAETKPAATPTTAPAKAGDTAEEPPPKTEAVAKKQEEQPKAKTADEAAKEPAPASTRGLYQVEPAGRTVQNAQATGSSNTGGFSGSRALSQPRAAVAGRTEEQKRAGEEKRAGEAKRDDANRAEAQDVSRETRTIAGRSFRKQGGIWTDTAYDSSTATVNVARSSEQFRALVADEPAIGTIARQLEGEVIVVWKGRPYHIR